MNEQKENDWRNVIEHYFQKNISIEIYFQYPQFDRPTRRSGKIQSVGVHNFGLVDIKIGLAYFDYNYIIEVKEFKE